MEKNWDWENCMYDGGNHGRCWVLKSPNSLPGVEGGRRRKSRACAFRSPTDWSDLKLRLSTKNWVTLTFCDEIAILLLRVGEALFLIMIGMPSIFRNAAGFGGGMGWGGTQARGVGEVKVERGRRRKEKQTTLPCTNVRTVLPLSHRYGSSLPRESP